MPVDERQAIQQAQKGDAEALVTLYRRYYDAIYTFLYHRTRNQELAEDLTADVFERMVEKIATYRQTSRPFLAWLYTLARNRLIDVLRREARAPQWEPLDAELHTPQAASPEVITEHRLTAECLHRVLTQLTPDQQQVIALKFLQGYRNEEIAARMGKPVGAVKSLQFRALAAMRRILKEEPC